MLFILKQGAVKLPVSSFITICLIDFNISDHSCTILIWLANNGIHLSIVMRRFFSPSPVCGPSTIMVKGLCNHVGLYLLMQCLSGAIWPAVFGDDAPRYFYYEHWLSEIMAWISNHIIGFSVGHDLSLMVTDIEFWQLSTQCGMKISSKCYFWFTGIWIEIIDIFFRENVFENVICKMSPILFWPRCDNGIIDAG